MKKSDKIRILPFASPNESIDIGNNYHWLLIPQKEKQSDLT